MSYLLDTNVISESVKIRPDPGVMRWLAEADEDKIWLSVITIAEIRLGVDAMPEGSRRNLLAHWLENDLPGRFHGRIIGIGLVVANAWGSVMAQSRKAGIGLNGMDAFVAAMAGVQNLTLVTRNVRHFAHLGVSLLNPWKSDL